MDPIRSSNANWTSCLHDGSFIPPQGSSNILCLLFEEGSVIELEVAIQVPKY